MSRLRSLCSLCPLSYVFSVPSAAAKAGWVIVCVRSGPVEIMPILAPRVRLDKAEVLLRFNGQLVVLGDAFGRAVPTLQRGVDGLDRAKAPDVGGYHVRLAAVDLIGSADRDFRRLIEHVHLGDYQPLGPVDHVRVAQERQVEPAAASRTTGDGAVFLAAGAQQLGRVAFDLGREGALADARDVGLGDPDDGVDAGRPDAGAGNRAAGCRGRARNEWVRPVVDIEQRALGAFEHHVFARVDGPVQQHRGIGDEGGDLVGEPGVILVHGARVERLGAEERVRDGVLLVAGVVDVGAKQAGVQQVGDAQAVAMDLVLVGGADAPAGGADGGAAGRGFGGQLDHAVVGQDHLGAVRDEQLAVRAAFQIGQAGFAQLLYFVQERLWIEHDAVADYAAAAGAKHTAGDELQDELAAVNDDRVPRIVAAGIAGDD